VYYVLWGIKGRHDSIDICSMLQVSWLHDVLVVVMPNCWQYRLMYRMLHVMAVWHHTVLSSGLHLSI